jgi:site-specific DNA recombinase
MTWLLRPLNVVGRPGLRWRSARSPAADRDAARRFPAEYALANLVSHPKNIYLKGADVLGHVDDWLTELFAPEAIDATVNQLTEQTERLEDLASQARAEAARARITEYDAEITQYRASLRAGGDPAVIGP